MPKPPPFTIKFMKWKTFCVVQPYSGTRSWFLTTWICRQQTAGKLQFLHEKEQKQLRWWHVATGEYEGKSGDAGVCGAEGIEGDVLPSGGMAGVHPPVSSDRREPTHLWDVHGNLERQRERERDRFGGSIKMVDDSKKQKERKKLWATNRSTPLSSVEEETPLTNASSFLLLGVKTWLLAATSQRL